MCGLDGDRKKNFRGICALLIGLLALAVLPAGAEQKQKDSLGIYTGWSFILGEAFIKDTPDGHTSNHYIPTLILGAYWQHSFSRSFGLQLNANYQNCTNNSGSNYYDRHEGETGFISCFSFSLNGIATVGRTALSEFYFLGGIGMFVGPFEYRKSVIQFSGGIGEKYRLGAGSRTSINLAAEVHYLLYGSSRGRNAAYLRLQAGLEFFPKDKQDNPVE